MGTTGKIFPGLAIGFVYPEKGIISAVVPGQDQRIGAVELRAALGYVWTRRGVRQREMAAAIGQGEQYLSRMLNGDRPLAISDLFQMAEAMGWPPGQIMVDLGRILLAGDQAAGAALPAPEGYIEALNHDAALTSFRARWEKAERDLQVAHRELDSAKAEIRKWKQTSREVDGLAPPGHDSRGGKSTGKQSSGRRGGASSKPRRQDREP